MPKLLLSSHAYFCLTDGAAIFLDLRRDKYIGVNSEHAAAMRAALDGATPQDSSPLLEELVSCGLLTRDVRLGKDLLLLEWVSATESLLDLDVEETEPIRWTHLYNFARSYATSVAALRFRKFESVVQTVRRAKANGASHGGDFGSSDVRQLVTIFLRLRPFFYTARDKCLLDCLVLVRFLARYYVFPTWVFGVQSKPFRSHCWVQDGSYALSDRPAFIKTFTPIMTV